MNECRKFFYQYDNTIEKMHKEREFVNSASVESHTITNGFILPLKRDVSINFSGGVVDSNKKFVAGLLRHHSHDWGPGCFHSYEFYDYVLSNESVIFGGVIIPHFGHFLIDSLSRLWYIVKNKAVINHYKIVFINSGVVPSYVYETLELLGLKREQIIFLREITQFKEIIIPAQSGYTILDYVHREYLTIYDEIFFNSIQKYKGPKYKKIFLSRAKCKSGYKIIGEDYFEKFFSEHGFEILYPDEMTMLEKVFLVGNANEIATTCGTIAHYSLFANKNCKFVILNRIFNFCPNAQILIDAIKDYECHIIDCSFNFLHADPYHGVSLLYPTKYWIDYVKKTYNEEVLPMDSEYIFEYIKYFYQFYKNRPTFDFTKEKFLKDFFERSGRLFFDEDFNALPKD